MLRFGVQDLLKQWKLGLAMSLVLATSFLGYLGLQAYQSSLASTFQALSSDYLQVHQFGSIGGRIPTSVGTQLRKLGASQVIAEIHTLVGTSPQDAVLLRGVDTAAYLQLQRIEVLQGQALHPGSPQRSVMLGWRLAQRLSAAPGERVSLRGRTFLVTGVFRTHTFVDNEAWISLQDAQKLLGWEEMVTSYLVPDEGVFQVGMLQQAELPQGLVALPRGETVRSGFEEYRALLDLFAAVIQFIGAAAMLILTNVLLRLAWLHRYEMAVLRAAGFPRRAFAYYLASQAVCITLAGVLLGAIGALVIGGGMDLWINGYQIQPVFSAPVLANSLMWATALTVLGSVLPAIWLGRYSPAQLLRV